MPPQAIQVLFSDGIHWRVFNADIQGNLYLTDYPDSEYHGGGEPRKRVMQGPDAVLLAFRALLTSLGEHSKSLHEHATVCATHLESIGKIAEAFAECKDAKPEIFTAMRTFGWSYLPGAWGEAVESSWAKFLQVARGAA